MPDSAFPPQHRISLRRSSTDRRNALPWQERRWEVASYVLIQIAGVARVIVLSGLAWSAAFAIFVLAYWPILTRPRIDGQPG